MSSDGEYGILYAWAKRKGLWLTDAEARELFDELKQERLRNAPMTLAKVEILDEMLLDEMLLEREGFLDYVIERMKRRVWQQVLESSWVPLEQPQVEQRRERPFSREELKITVSVRCGPAES